jgi:hypothetical protein
MGWVTGETIATHDDLQMLACLEGAGSLLLVINRPATGEPQSDEAELFLPSGEPLPRRVQISTGTRWDDFLITKFTKPPDDTPYVELKVHRDGVLVVHLQLVHD